MNPYTIFAVEMLGVPDVVATFLTLAAAAFLIEDRKDLASIFSGWDCVQAISNIADASVLALPKGEIWSGDSVSGADATGCAGGSCGIS